jgi:BirA family transcriptional regulator, biotin operon repressor / biotin---[acetyl-CoA-carboxylase] ligase
MADDRTREGSTARRILEILHEARGAGGAVSGPDIARRLGISRAEVWKHIETLVAQGYEIARDNVAGYRLESVTPRLVPAEIARRLTTERIGRIVHHFDSIDSTNRHAMELARRGAREGEVVLAEAQTAGRGRLGRTFFSPAGVSLYGSIILRPAIAPARAPQVTLVAGLAVAETIEHHAGSRPGLKWPNDLHLGGRKVAGILTEMEAEADRVLHVVCGPGVNLNVPADDFPADLASIATSVLATTGRAVDRVAFAADLFASFERHYDTFLAGGLRPLQDLWNSYSVLTGRFVTVEGGGATLEGKVLGIDDEGGLLLERRGGKVARAIAGDVTLKKT